MQCSPQDISLSKAAGTGQAGQAKTGPLFLALGLVIIVNCIDRPTLPRNITFPKVLVSFGPNSKVLLRSLSA